MSGVGQEKELDRQLLFSFAGTVPLYLKFIYLHERKINVASDSINKYVKLSNKAFIKLR